MKNFFNKKYFLIALIVFAGFSFSQKIFAADTTLYVNTASTAGGDCTTNATSGANRACATLFAAEALIPADITTGISAGIWTIMAEGSVADTHTVTFAGTVTDATHYIVVTTNSATTYGRHNGVWNINKYRIEVADSNAIDVRENHVKIDGLQIASISPTANGRSAIVYTGPFTNGNNRLDLANTIIKGHGNASFTQVMIGNSAANANINVWNVIGYGLNTTNSGNYYIYLNQVSILNVHSSTFIGGYRGIRNVSGTLTCKNTYVGGTGLGTSDYVGTITKTTCASSDSTGSTGLQSIAINTTNFTNITGGSEDYHLPNSSALVNAGTDTSGDVSPLNFTTDIDGQTRSGVWDIGADEYLQISAGPSRSNGSPNGNINYNNTSTVISLETNVAATCRYSTSAGVVYDSMTNNFSTTNGTAHTATVSGLTSGGSYTYYVRCYSDSANTDDFIISFTVGSKHYIRVGATGGDNGIDWDNAFANIPASLVRGDAYYFADGDYNTYTFDDNVSGTLPITFVKAISSDHGSETGWLSSYGDGQASFSNLTFSTSYYVINGQIRNSDWETGYGFKVHPIVSGNKAIRINNSLQNITLKYIDIEYLGDTGQRDDGVYATSVSNLNIQYSYIHDIATNPITLAGSNNLIEYTKIARTFSNVTNHAQGMQMFGTNTNTTIRYNIFEDIGGTASIAVAWGTDGLYIYGNIFTQTAGYSGMGTGTGQIVDISEAGETGLSNAAIYNNTFANLHEGLNSGIRIYLAASETNYAYNNLWYNSVQAALGGLTDHDYNDFYSTPLAFGTSFNTHENSVTGNPFINSSGANYHLLLTTISGKNDLGSPYNSDFEGNIRGADGLWDKGAYEYNSSSDKAITTFNFASPAVTGVVNEGAKTVTLTVPYGTSLTNLVPTITITGSSVNPVSGASHTFVDGVSTNYTVTAADASTAVYAVTVNVSLNTAKAITAFNFSSPSVTGTVNETDHTVALTVPFGTAVTALIPTITITGASVSPLSGVEGNFTTPQTYTVTAADSSIQAYVVTVTVAADTTPAPAPVVSSSGGNGPIYGSTRHNISNLLVTTQTVSTTTATTTQPKYTFSRNLSLHTTGQDVKNLQKLLNSFGFIISKTGAGALGKETTLFGTLTYKALQKFQKSVGLPATGYFGPMTREYLKTH